MKSLWAAWNQTKGLTILRSNKAAIPYIAQDSVWWCMGGMKQVCSEDYEKARKLNNEGIKAWGDLWDMQAHTWYDDQQLTEKFRVDLADIRILRERIQVLDNDDWWKDGIREKLNPKGIGWTERVPIFPIPMMELAPPIHTTLNKRWDVTLDRRQWYFKFVKIWSPTILPKTSTHLCLILHKGLWTGARAPKLA